MSEAKVNYLHGFDETEQQRLRSQARILGSRVMNGVSYPDTPGTQILEVGCGVGAQTELLLERFENLAITSLDRAETQLACARSFFSVHPNRGRTDFILADALALPFPDQTFDGAFVCWVLEHLPDPVRALQEIHRCLKPGARIHLNEVFNQPHFIYPGNGAVAEYYEAFNRLQQELGGDPHVGIRLGNLLSQAGFKSIETEVNPELWDSRDVPGRSKMVDYWLELLKSAAPTLLERGRITQSGFERAMAAVQEVGARPDGVLFYAWVKASALKN